MVDTMRVPSKQNGQPQSFARRAVEDSQGDCFTAGETE